MKKLRMLVMFVLSLMVLNIGLPLAFAEDSAKKQILLEEPYAYIESCSNYIGDFDIKIPYISFYCTAYENQTVAKQNPTIVYTDTFPIYVYVYTVEQKYSVTKIKGYGLQLAYTLYEKHSQHPAYVYLDLRKGDPSRNNTIQYQNECNNKTASFALKNSEIIEKFDYVSIMNQFYKSVNKNFALSNLQDFISDNFDKNAKNEKTLSKKVQNKENVNQSKASSSYSSNNGKTLDGTFNKIPNESSQKSESIENIDYTSILNQLGSSIDRNVALSDLQDFISEKWDGIARDSVAGCRYIQPSLRIYEYASDYIMHTAKLDYNGELPSFPCKEYTLVQDGNTIEQWKYFKKIDSWEIHPTDKIDRVCSIFNEEKNYYGIIFITDEQGESHIYVLYANGITERL